MSIEYIISEGVAGFKRAKLASFTSIFSLFVAVFLLGILARVSYNAYEVAQALRQSVDVEVFLQDMNQSETDDLKNKIENECFPFWKAFFL